MATFFRLTVVCGLLAVTGGAAFNIYRHFSPAGQMPKRESFAGQRPEQAQPQPETRRPVSPAARQAAWAKIYPHVAEAQRAGHQAVARHCARVTEFFRERRKRARAFAYEALSLRSKWEFMKSKLTDGRWHQHFLHERFEATVFSEQELADLLKSVVEGYVQDLKGIENELLVKIRADLDDSQLCELRAGDGFMTDDVFRFQYAQALEDVASTMARDLTVAIGREIVAWVASDIATSITVSLTAALAERLGVSAGILGGSFASGIATLGTGLVAGIIIDSLLDWLIEALGYDPAGDIEGQINLALDEFEGVFLLGDKYQPPFVCDFGLDADRRSGRTDGRWNWEFDDRRSGRADSNWEWDWEFNDRSGRANRHLDHWWVRVKAARNVKCSGLEQRLVDVCEQRGRVRDAALRKLILEGGLR